MNSIFNPWPWYVSGPLIGLILFLLLKLGKNFGVSANLRTLCTILGAGKTASFFKFDWKTQKWNLTLIVGTLIGGYIAAHFLSHSNMVSISEPTISKLEDLGFTSAGSAYLPPELFSVNSLSLKNILILVVGGFLVGFGARYAGGCTSGHAISGLSNLQLPSLLAVVGFFIGGLVMIHVLFPLIF